MTSLQKIWHNVYLRTALIVAAVLLIGWMLGKTELAWRSFLIAFMIAYIFNPVVERLQAWRLPRWLGVGLSMTFIVSLVGITLLMLLAIVDSLIELPINAASALSRAPDWYSNHAPEWLKSAVTQGLAFLNEDMPLDADAANNADTSTNAASDGNFAYENDSDLAYEANYDAILQWLGRAAQAIMLRIVSSTQGFFQNIANIFVLFVFTGFTLGSFPQVKKSLIEIFPQRHRPLVHDLAAKMDASVGGYMRSKLLEGAIMGAVTWLYLSLLGVPDALALGFLNAILSPIPYVGAFVSTGVAALLALTVSWKLAIIVLIIAVVVENLNGNILGPLLLSQGVDLHPLLILSAIIVGGALFGFWGILLAIPITGFLQLVYRQYYQGGAWYQKDATPE